MVTKNLEISKVDIEKSESFLSYDSVYVIFFSFVLFFPEAVESPLSPQDCEIS